MFVPELYRPPGPRWTGDLVRGFPLAVLVTSGPERPFATHLPTLLAEDLDGGEPAGGDLAGGRIYGHLNRANPHWAALAPGLPATLIFQGPNGYVSPTVYRVTPAAPTWNFTAVHLHGTVQPIHDPAQTMRIVRATVRALECRHGTGWDPNGSADYFRTLLPGVGAFALDIESADGMFKLSQEQPPEIRRRTGAAFSASERGLHQELAALMNRLEFATTGE
jgi:transcriptional regulator